MNLGLSGKTALVCGASKGLGYACALSLAREGVSITIVARNRDALAHAADQISRTTNSEVKSVEADITETEGRELLLSFCPSPDILVTNCGGPKPGRFDSLTREDWMGAVNANMYAAISLIQSVVQDMVKRRFGRIVNIASSAVKMPSRELALSNGARAGLIGAVAGLARDVVEYNVTVNNLLPGPFETDRILALAAKNAELSHQSIEAALQAIRGEIPARRLGRPTEFGDACAYLCSEQAGFITGQSLLLDGGRYPGIL